MVTNLIITTLIKLLVFQCLMPWLATSSLTNLTDESTLLAFKSQLTFKNSDDQQLMVENWTTKAPFCDWMGVSCSLRRQRVTALELPYMEIQGKISPFIGNLSFLAVLNLRNNSFRGQLPETLGRLHRLRVIDLGYNQLEGVIPSSLLRCSRLETIILGSNQLQGNIPKEIGSLHGLRLLGLFENYLTGSIPVTLFNISTLQVIDLMVNKLSGSIPTSICHKLPELRLLYLSFNRLVGPFPPTLCQCKSLSEIYANNNNFTGSIPKDIGCLSKLEYLLLSYNPLTGTIPPSLGNLSRLLLLHFSRNYFSGGIPQELAMLSMIKILVIQFNLLSGRIPKAIFNLSSLESISFMDNRLSANVYPEVLNGGPFLPSLERINLGDNQLTGTIPLFLSNSSKLTLLQVSRNSFSGVVPMTLGNLRFLQTLNLRNNELTGLDFLTSLTQCGELKNLVVKFNPLNGQLPRSFGNLSTSLEIFSASVSQINGSIPSSIGNLSNIWFLELAGNDLTGSIPHSIGKIDRIQRLLLFNNNLEGLIPNGLCQSKFLGELMLYENNLSGSIPSCIGNLSRMQRIDLSTNSLSSIIPLTIWSLDNVWYMNLSHNLLRGFLPPEIGNLVFLVTLNLSYNQFSGSIPSQISDLKMLRELIVSNNEFEGTLPDAIGNLGSIESLDLSSNNFSGIIPKSLESLQYLKYLNLSFNMLIGEVPIGGPFINFTAQSFLGNDKLCATLPKLKLPTCHKRSKRTTRVWLKYFLPTASAIVIVSLLIVFVKYGLKRRKVPYPVDHLLIGINPQLISHYELVRATCNFTEANLLGAGSFGSVYKGTLSDGKVVAVKVLDLQVEGALRSFDAECHVLRNVKHRNLVKIITSCSNLDFRALVLQYMPNGSLEKLLYSTNQNLDFHQRLTIMIDVALAMEYLHHGYSEPVVHCDLKPSNILLDEDMVSHVGDFGIAKVLAKYKSETQTHTLGTMGYIAPEFGSQGRVSTKGDVFSYGIVLMEVFTRKKPTDEMFVGASSLRQWVHNSFPDHVMEIADINLLIYEEGEMMEDPCHSISSIFELSLLCTKDLADERLTMVDVVARLTKIKQRFIYPITSE